jgi:hypothetical protein
MTIGKGDDVDSLSQIYTEMNETGKKKLKQVADRFMGIWYTVNGEAAKPAYAGLNKKRIRNRDLK